MQKMLYISGQMRSGTTALASLIAAQDGVEVEYDYFRVAAASRSALNCIWNPDQPMPPHARRQFFQAFLNATAVGFHGTKRMESFKEFLREDIRGEKLRDRTFQLEEIGTLPSFNTLRQFYKRYLPLVFSKNAKIIGNKETRAEGFVNVLARDNIYAVVTIRDPRDVCLSYMQKVRSGKFGSNFEPEQIAAFWRTSFQVWKNSKNMNLLAIRYEDLIGNREDVLERMSLFLNHRIVDKPVPMANSSFGDVKTGGLRESALARWKRTPDDPLVKQIEGLLHEEMREVGYEV